MSITVEGVGKRGEGQGRKEGVREGERERKGRETEREREKQERKKREISVAARILRRQVCSQQTCAAFLNGL